VSSGYLSNPERKLSGTLRYRPGESACRPVGLNDALPMRQDPPPLTIWLGLPLSLVLAIVGVEVWANTGASAPHPGGWPEWVTAIATAVLAIAGGAALLSLRDARRTRHAQILTDLSARWDSAVASRSQRRFLVMGRDEVTTLFRRLYEPQGDRTLEQFEADLKLQDTLLIWPNLLETIGVLRSTRIVSTEIVYRMWGFTPVVWWRSWAPIVEELRTHPGGHPGIFRQFQGLSEVIEAHAARLGEPIPPPRSSDESPTT
jgi:hypothetical protein